MSFKIGERIRVKNIMGALDNDGTPAQVICDVLSLSKVHVIAKVTYVPQGVVIAINDEGGHVVVNDRETLPQGALRLQVGDVHAFPLDACMTAVAPTPKTISREETKQKLGYSEDQLEDAIKRRALTPTRSGEFLPTAVEALATIEENITREQRRSGDKAKQFNELGRELHPQFFERSW